MNKANCKILCEINNSLSLHAYARLHKNLLNSIANQETETENIDKNETHCHQCGLHFQMFHYFV